MLKFVLEALEQNAQNAIPTNAESIPPWSLTELEKINKQTNKPTKIIRITTFTQRIWLPNNFLQVGLFPPLTASESKRSLPNSFKILSRNFKIWRWILTRISLSLMLWLKNTSQNYICHSSVLNSGQIVSLVISRALLWLLRNCKYNDRTVPMKTIKCECTAPD